MFEFVRIVEESKRQDQSGAWWVAVEFSKDGNIFYENFKMTEYPTFEEVNQACLKRVQVFNDSEGV